MIWPLFAFALYGLLCFANLLGKFLVRWSLGPKPQPMLIAKNGAVLPLSGWHAAERKAFLDGAMLVLVSPVDAELRTMGAK
jgi:hypothetical protein